MQDYILQLNQIIFILQKYTHLILSLAIKYIIIVCKLYYKEENIIRFDGKWNSWYINKLFF